MNTASAMIAGPDHRQDRWAGFRHRSRAAWVARRGHGPLAAVGLASPATGGVARARAARAWHVIDAGAEHDAVDDHEQNERGEHAAAGNRRDRVGGAHQAVDDPGLAADLGREPAGEQGDEAERRDPWQRAQEPAAVVEPAAGPEHAAEPTAIMSMPRPDHDPEGAEQDDRIGRSSGGKCLRPCDLAVPAWVRIRLPSCGIATS